MPVEDTHSAMLSGGPDLTFGQKDLSETNANSSGAPLQSSKDEDSRMQDFTTEIDQSHANKSGDLSRSGAIQAEQNMESQRTENSIEEEKKSLVPGANLSPQW